MDISSDNGTAIIQLIQLPVISERLQDVRADWENMTRENISLVCTEDTIQSVKSARTSLTKKFNELEDLRKQIKAQYMAAYSDFERVYAQCISEPYKAADRALKAKIKAVEGEIKGRCEQKCREYFLELCAVYNIDFLTFEQTGVKVDLTSAKAKKPNNLFKQVKSFIENVDGCLNVIDTMTDAGEIAVEYKKCLNLNEAVTRVAERHEALGREREDAAIRQKAREQVEANVERVNAALQATSVPVPAAFPPEQVQQTALDDDSKILKCTFTVHATKNQLQKLKQFLNDEGIQYE